jgi:hypothetical protein
MGLGVADLIFLAVLIGVLLVPTLAVLTWVAFRRRAVRFGYPSTGAYLRAAPHTDAERRDAVDLAMKGLVLCVLGVLFPPFVLIGLIPLFYGGRKLITSSLGLGLVDDPEQRGA